MHAAAAVTSRHSGEWPPLWRRRRECPWTDRTFLAGLLMFSFLILKNFSQVFGSWPMWSMLPFWVRRLSSPRVMSNLFAPNLQHLKGNWRQPVRDGQKWIRQRGMGIVINTYLCGSCAHVWARPDKGTVVDSTHLLHKCKDPDPAFCKRNSNRHMRRGLLSGRG